MKYLIAFMGLIATSCQQSENSLSQTGANAPISTEAMWTDVAEYNG